METIELKNRIQHFLDKADTKALNIVLGVFENYFEDEVVAYHPNNSPMSRKEYNAALAIAEKQILNGEVVSVEELLDEN